MKYKHILTLMFWSGWAVAMANMIFGLPINAIIGDSVVELTFTIISMLLLIGMAVVEAVESSHTIINVDRATIIGGVTKEEEGKK